MFPLMGSKFTHQMSVRSILPGETDLAVTKRGPKTLLGQSCSPWPVCPNLPRDHDHCLGRSVGTLTLPVPLVPMGLSSVNPPNHFFCLLVLPALTISCANKLHQFITCGVKMCFYMF